MRLSFYPSCCADWALEGNSEHMSILTALDSPCLQGVHRPVVGGGKVGEAGLERGSEKQLAVTSTVSLELFLAACAQSCKR